MALVHEYSIDAAAWHSPWRHVWVGTKAWLSVGIILTSLLWPVWPSTLLGAILAAILALTWARVDHRMFLLVVLGPLAFVLISALPAIVTIGSAPIDAYWSWPILGTAISISPASLTMTTTLLARGVVGTTALALFALTTPMTQVFAGLASMRLPAPLIDMMALIYRLIWLSLAIAGAMVQAQQMRLGYSTRQRAQHSLGIVLATLLVRTWSKAMRIEAGITGRQVGDIAVTIAPPSPLSRATQWRIVAGCAGLLGLLNALCAAVATCM